MLSTILIGKIAQTFPNVYDHTAPPIVKPVSYTIRKLSSEEGTQQGKPEATPLIAKTKTGTRQQMRPKQQVVVGRRQSGRQL